MLRLIDRCLAALAIAAMASLVAAIVMVAADIIVRKTLARSLIGAVDITELAVVVSAYLSIPLVFLRRGHVAVEVVTDALPPRARDVLDGVGALIGAALFATIGWLSLQPAQMSAAAGDVSSDLAIPVLWYWMPMIAGCFLSAFAAVVVALRLFLVGAERRA